MHYQELVPPAELQGLVHRLWALHGPDHRGGPFQRAMPDGRAELIFNFGDPFECRDGERVRTQPLSLLVGPSRRAMAIRPGGRIDLIGVRFRPEALAAWLRVGGGELADEAFDLCELPAPLDRALPERLAETGGTTARLAVLGRELARSMDRVGRDRRLTAAVDLMMGQARARPDRVADLVGLGRRQLARLFREGVGLGPGSLARLSRFQRVLRALDGDARVPLARVAARAGYFDQAHMSRDFRRFGGTTPAAYRRELRELTRHFLDTTD